MFLPLFDPYVILFAILFGGFMLPVHLVLQMVHDERGFGWREVVFGALAFSSAMGVFVILGSATEQTSRELQLAVGMAGTLLLTTLAAGIAGRTLGWALMRVVRLV